MSASEFIIVAAIVIVGLIFLVVGQRFIFGSQEETIQYSNQAEAEGLVSLINRVVTEPASHISYSQYISLSNITIKDGILTYERESNKYSFQVPKNVSDVYLEETTSICVIKTDEKIMVSEECPKCNLDSFCTLDECKESCPDCLGPKKICIGDGFCNLNIGENCENSPSDCKCASGKICCPKSPDSDGNGCSLTKDLKKKGEQCWCDSQCDSGLNCNPTAKTFKGYSKACCEEGKSWNGTDCEVKKVKLKILFVPVNWNGGLDAFDSAADGQMKYLVDNIPMSSCPEEANAIKIHNNCQFAMTCDDPDISNIKKCADASGEEYDYAIGLNNGAPCGNIAGFSTGRGTVFVLAKYPAVTAHELGHEWGLNDEYVDACRCGYGLVSASSNCLKSELSGNDPISGYTSAYCGGGQCAGYTITCMGNKNPLGGRCIMSYANAPEPRAYCQECMNHLLTIPIINC